MIGDALALEQQRAKEQRAIAWSSAGQAFERHRIGPRIRDRTVAGYAARESRAFLQRHRFEALLDSLVLVAEPLLEPQQLFAHDREAEMPRLDRAGVHRADRDLVHPF